MIPHPFTYGKRHHLYDFADGLSEGTMDNKRLADIVMLLLLVLAIVVALTVSLLIFTFIFAWVANIIDDGFAVIHSVALVLSALIIALALYFKK